MQQYDFETLFAQLENNFSIVSDKKFMQNLKASISTPQQWCRLLNLCCDSYNELIKLLQSKK